MKKNKIQAGRQYESHEDRYVQIGQIDTPLTDGLERALQSMLKGQACMVRVVLLSLPLSLSPPLCLSVCLSVSLSHTHTLSVFLCLSFSLSLSLSLSLAVSLTHTHSLTHSHSLFLSLSISLSLSRFSFPSVPPSLLSSRPPSLSLLSAVYLDTFQTACRLLHTHTYADIR